MQRNLPLLEMGCALYHAHVRGGHGYEQFYDLSLQHQRTLRLWDVDPLKTSTSKTAPVLIIKGAGVWIEA
jgi:hypothetical protein